MQERPNKIAKTTKGASRCAKPHDEKQATVVARMGRRTKWSKPSLSDKKLKFH